MEAMKSARQFGALVLLLLSWLAPAMACMTSDAQLTQQERACWRMMKNQCGHMGMPASHGCCHKILPSVHDNALDTKIIELHPVAITAIWLTASELLNPTSVVTGSIEHPDYSPPNSSSSVISILKI